MEVQLCMGYFGFHLENELEFSDTRMLEGEKICRHLMEEKMIALEEGKYRFTPLGQYVINTMGASDLYLEMSRGENRKRTIFIKNENYVCLDEKGEEVIIYLLPSLPMVMGACTSFWKEGITIKGISGNNEFLMNITGPEKRSEIYQKKNGTECNKTYEKAECANDVWLWILSSLGEVRK